MEWYELKKFRLANSTREKTNENTLPIKLTFSRYRNGTEYYQEYRFVNPDLVEKMRDYGNSGTLCEYGCEFCNKFKWAVDRAKHYAEKTGLPYTDILNGWERDRDYWYLNYYQDCNQPKFKDGEVFVFETMQDYQNGLKGQGFICPKCGAETKSPFECKCNWKSYGLFRFNLVTVFVKENMAMAQMFMPVAWQKGCD